MKFILAKKHHMTQSFDSEGRARAVTVLEAGPVTVTQVKNGGKDSYTAVQVGFGEQNPKRLSRPVLGHLKKTGSFKNLKEFRIKDPETLVNLKVGDRIDVSVFYPGDRIAVSAISKGRGFQGVVKRHGFKGGPRSHGQKHSEREPGSIGGGLRTRVPKGMRMAGRMGADRVTVENLQVVHIDPDKNQLLVSGAVPGRKGTLVEVVSD